MVKLPVLRKQLLIAMGLPVSLSCGGAQQPPGPPGGGSGESPGDGAEARAGERDVERTSSEDIRLTDGRVVLSAVPAGAPGGPPGGASCGPDAYFETVCGGAEAGCGPRANSVSQPTDAVLSITARADRGAWASFRFDERATANYQETGGAPPMTVPGSYCCYSECTPLPALSAVTPRPIPAGFYGDDHCIPRPPNGTRVPAANSPDCPAGIELAGTPRPFSRGDATSCCYTVIKPVPPPRKHYRGRALRVAGEVREADVVSSEAWATAIGRAVDTDGLAGALRARLARTWRAEAQMEHASIASFSRVSLELIALGAPPELLAQTYRAAADEVLHAQLAFAIASAYGDEPVGPAPFPAAGELSITGDAQALAVETFVDGCVAETVAAVVAQHASDRAGDPAVAAAQQRIADDESRHAELAWAILAFCHRRVDGAPALGKALRGALAAARSSEQSSACGADCVTSDHGLLCSHRQAQIHAQVVDDVIAPCLDALLA